MKTLAWMVAKWIGDESVRFQRHRDGVILIECNKIIISVCFGINWDWRLNWEYARSNEPLCEFHTQLVMCISFYFKFSLFLFTFHNYSNVLVSLSCSVLPCDVVHVNRFLIRARQRWTLNDICVQIGSRYSSTGLFIAMVLRYPIWVHALHGRWVRMMIFPAAVFVCAHLRSHHSHQLSGS